MTFPIADQDIAEMTGIAEEGYSDRRGCHESVMDLLAIYEHSRSRAIRRLEEDEEEK